MADTLELILNGVKGKWKEDTLLDNHNGNDLVDAYNEGVKAMAAQVAFYVHHTMELNALQRKIADQCHTLTIEIVGEQ